MRVFKREIIESAKIEKLASEGKSIFKYDGKVVFVPFAVPGDIADILITKKRSDYLEGKVIELKEKSAIRCEPRCSHFGTCGGCKWQMLPYSEQIKYKKQQVEDQLIRIGKLKFDNIYDTLGSENIYFYRNKLEYTFSTKRWIDNIQELGVLGPTERYGLGFHLPGMFDKVLDIDTCYLQKSPSNEIRLFIKKFSLENNIEFFDLREQTGFLRNLVIRTTSTNEVMITLVFAKNDQEIITKLLNSIKEAFIQVTSINYFINSKRNDSVTDLNFTNFSGNDAIYEKMEDLRFKIGPKSFYQTNSEQSYQLYKVVRDYAQLTGNEVVYDLYTGTGTIALFIAKYSKKVVGIEYVREAVEDAQENALINQITNVTFHYGDMKELLNDNFIIQNGIPDVVILDPPRAGIHSEVANVILKASPSKIVYVSCNPATQARDLNIFCEQYQIKKVQPVDMFPHTHHIENVVLLERL